MKIHDSERSLAHIIGQGNVSERIMHDKWDFLLFGIDNSSGLKSLLKHDDFHDDDNY